MILWEFACHNHQVNLGYFGTSALLEGLIWSGTVKHGFIECPGQKIAAVSDRITIVF